MAEHDLSGVWQSRYQYYSDSRKSEFEDKHIVHVHQKGNQLVIESLPKINKSYLVLRLSLNDNIATGTWQEHTEEKGYYKGTIYQGVVQLIIDTDKKHMRGKWIGAGQTMQINTGPWEFTYIGKTVPADK